MSNKKILVIGKGGREHALAMAFAKSSLVEQVYIAPGNDGMTQDKLCPIKRIDYENIVTELAPDLVFIGPEDVLASGLVDKIQHKTRVFGPNQFATQLESSKAYAKEVMQKLNLPCAKSVTVNSYAEGLREIERWPNEKIVLKASELAAGKGVLMCENKIEAQEQLWNLFENDKFSVSSQCVVMEEWLEGRELSVFYLCHEEVYQRFGHAQDFKRLGENDLGPNTGGMGCVFHPSQINPSIIKQTDHIASQITHFMLEQGHAFTGVLFLGLMVDQDEQVKLLEFNVRFGDPETQTLLAALETDFYALVDSIWDKAPIDINFKNCSLHWVLASGGYPSMSKNESMLLNQKLVIERRIADTLITYAGVAQEGDSLVNTGGRVLGVSSSGEDFKVCYEKVSEQMKLIHLEGGQYRSDIGKSYV